MARRLLPLWLFGLSGLAIVWPTVWDRSLSIWGFSLPSEWKEFDPFLGSRVLLSPIVAGTMFCIGCLLPRNEVQEMGRRWPTILKGTCVQYLAMPLLAWSLGRTLRLSPPMLVGLMMAGCVPGAMASNVLTLVARGNVSYSVGLTTSATLVSPLVVPCALWLTLGTLVDPGVFLSAGVDLLRLVVLPVALGFCVSQRWNWIGRQTRLAELVANVSVLWIIATVVGLNRHRLSEATLLVMAALLALNLGGYLAGWWGGRLLQLPDTMRRALTLEVGMQNAGLGAALATQLFEDLPGASLPPALYAFGCMLTGSLLAAWMSTRPVESRRLNGSNQPTMEDEAQTSLEI